MRCVRIVAALAPLLLGGCHILHGGSCNNPQSYQGARSVAPLKIPAGLDAPDTANALRIPALNEPQPPPRQGKAPCLDAPPSFKVQKPPPPPQA